MSRHVIGTFGIVFILRAAIRRNALHEPLEIPSYRTVGVLGDHHGCAGVPNEDLTDPAPNAGLFDDPSDLRRDHLGCATAGLNPQQFLSSHDLVCLMRVER
jgi:hypothetical protein